MKIKLILTAVTLLGTAHMANAVDIYNSRGFEYPTFVTGHLIALDDAGNGLQDGWTFGATPAVTLNPEAAFITNNQAKSGRQSVVVRGVDMVSTSIDGDDQTSTFPFYDAVGSYRRKFPNYTVTDEQPIVKLEADIKIETNRPLTANDFFCATITPRLAGTSTGPNPNGINVGETGLCSNGTATGTKFGANPSSAPADFERRGIRMNRWYHLAEFVNFNDKTIIYTVDGRLIHVTIIPRNGIDTRNLIRAAMVVYVRPTGGNKANYIARFDNFKISAHHDYED